MAQAPNSKPVDAYVMFVTSIDGKTRYKILADYVLEVAEDVGVPMTRQEADAIGVALSMDVVDLVEQAVATHSAVHVAAAVPDQRDIRPKGTP